MPKRANPFGECSPLQMKSHIRQKEVNMGVCGEKNLMKIYDHTRQLLFDGVQNLPTTHTDMNCEVTRDTPTPPPGQMCLDAQGYVTAPSSVNINNNNVEMPCMEGGTKCKPTIKCCCCGCISTLKSQCSFCDRMSCPYCIHYCQSCADIFCSNCSIINYDESEERAFCLNCVT